MHLLLQQPVLGLMSMVGKKSFRLWVVEGGMFGVEVGGSV